MNIFKEYVSEKQRQVPEYYSLRYIQFILQYLYQIIHYEIFPVEMNQQQQPLQNIHQQEHAHRNHPTDQFVSENFMNGMGLTFNMNNLGVLMPPNFTSQDSCDEEQNLIDNLLLFAQCQNQALKSLISKVDGMTERTLKLNQQLSDFRLNSTNMMSSNFNETFTGNQTLASSNKPIDNIDANSLIKILFGSNQQYKYKLRLCRPIENPLYRQRNFSIDVQLVDLEGNKVQNTNKIPLSLAIYTSENPPKFLQTNTVGMKMVKGYTQQNLYFGSSKFEKIQIRQVTSHFRNGWIFIVVIPSMTPLGEQNKQKNFIYYKQIQPLVLEKIVVKAKKIKENNKQLISKNQSKMNDQSIEQEEQLLSKKSIKSNKQQLYQDDSFSQN